MQTCAELEQPAQVESEAEQLHILFYQRGVVIAETDADSVADAFTIAARPLSEGGFELDAPYNTMVVESAGEPGLAISRLESVWPARG